MILKNLIAIWTFILKEVFIRRMDVAWYVLGPFSFIQLTKLCKAQGVKKERKNAIFSVCHRLFEDIVIRKP